MPSAVESAAIADTAATPSTATEHYVYERRRPELGTLHQVVRENLLTLYAAVEEGSASPLPEFVRREFEQFLDCGLLCRGFALFECEDCSERRLVALSCKGRAWCPACCGRRMAQTAANLVDHVLPPAVPLRQFVVTFPFELRSRCVG
ncbi:transposase zinc-binding domain-containing protein [Myxococcota bacterium]